MILCFLLNQFKFILPCHFSPLAAHRLTADWQRWRRLALPVPLDGPLGYVHKPGNLFCGGSLLHQVGHHDLLWAEPLPFCVLVPECQKGSLREERELV